MNHCLRRTPAPPVLARLRHSEKTERGDSPKHLPALVLISGDLQRHNPRAGRPLERNFVASRAGTTESRRPAKRCSADLSRGDAWRGQRRDESGRGYVREEIAWPRSHAVGSGCMVNTGTARVSGEGRCGRPVSAVRRTKPDARPADRPWVAVHSLEGRSRSTGAPPFGMGSHRGHATRGVPTTGPRSRSVSRSGSSRTGGSSAGHCS
jgi:hypothetical protein